MSEPAFDPTNRVGWRRTTLFEHHGIVPRPIVESLSVAGDVGIWSAAGSLVELGRVKHAQGELPAARAFLSEALEKHRVFGSRHDFAMTLIYLGMLSLAESGGTDDG